jgi:TPP-dependent pyruvate/acetoin dehydrogenase alpha subunit
MVGPCGEEILSAAACALQPQDTVALHYRHLGISMARSLLHTVPGSISFSSSSLLEQIILDRARAYVVSKHDPVTGGVHCALGSTLKKNDFVVTSTLASQCPPAVGRALGFSLANKLLKEKDDKGSKRPISFVSIGDGYVLWVDVQISDDI